MTEQEIEQKYQKLELKYPSGRYCSSGDFGCNVMHPIRDFPLTTSGYIHMPLCRKELSKYKNAKRAERRAMWQGRNEMRKLSWDYKSCFVLTRDWQVVRLGA